jgi:hypothetical protein
MVCATIAATCPAEERRKLAEKARNALIKEYRCKLIKERFAKLLNRNLIE